MPAIVSQNAMVLGRNMSNQTVLILGATSDMAQAVARGFSGLGWDVQLAARRPEAVSDLAAELGASVHSFDALELDTHGAFADGLPDLPDVAVCAVGAMGDQDESARDPMSAVEIMVANYNGPASILAELANRFEARGSGTLVGISSVAGERGRASNYVYGSAKAGFTAFLSGLRNRLAKKGVHVVTVLPGFTRTKMTEGMDLPKKLTAEPEEVSDAILKAVAKQQNVIYVRPIWRVVMAIIRNIPERMFKKMSL